MTASTLRLTGNASKNSLRAWPLMIWQIEMSYPLREKTALNPSMMVELNQVLKWSLMSTATRKDWPDLSAVAEREIEKFNFRAVDRTLERVRSDTSSGRVNDLETVDTETFACLATSWIVDSMGNSSSMLSQDQLLQLDAVAVLRYLMIARLIEILSVPYMSSLAVAESHQFAKEQAYV